MKKIVSAIQTGKRTQPEKRLWMKFRMPLIRAATDQEVRGGEYFGPSKDRMPDVVQSNKASHNLETAAKLWKVSEELTGLYYLDD